MTEVTAPTAVARAIADAMVRKGLTVLGMAAVSRGLIYQGSVDGAMCEAVELTLGALSVGASGAWT